MATHSSILAWRISGTGEPGGLLSLGSHRVRHGWSDLAAAAAASKSFAYSSIAWVSIAWALLYAVSVCWVLLCLRCWLCSGAQMALILELRALVKSTGSKKWTHSWYIPCKLCERKRCDAIKKIDDGQTTLNWRKWRSDNCFHIWVELCSRVGQQEGLFERFKRV